MIMIYYQDKNLKKKIACPGSLYNNYFKKRIDFMCLAKRCIFKERVTNDRHCACLLNKPLSYKWVASILRHPVIIIKFDLARETDVQSPVESYQRLRKWYLIPPCLTLSIIRYGSRVKWSNPGKGVAPPTPRCSSYRKRSLRVTLDLRETTLLT